MMIISWNTYPSLSMGMCNRQKSLFSFLHSYWILYLDTFIQFNFLVNVDLAWDYQLRFISFVEWLINLYFTWAISFKPLNKNMSYHLQKHTSTNENNWFTKKALCVSFNFETLDLLLYEGRVKGIQIWGENVTVII